MAAHPDDCVIVAGEYALRAREAGKRVQVIYLTCGDRTPGSARALARRAEAIRAWAIAGVPEEELSFFDLRETPLTDKRASYLPENYARVQIKLDALFRDLAGGSVVFIPADGELHPDHRELRELALTAYRRSVRHDIALYESPEYHAYFSLTRTPVRTLMYMVSSIPVVTRFVRPRSGGPPAFHDGPPGVVLKPDALRLEKKREMLRAFSSENPGDILVKLFGWPDNYRPVDVDAATLGGTGRFYLKVGEKFLSPSIMAFWLSLWSVILVALFMMGRLKQQFFEDSKIATIITACVGVVLLGFAFVRRHSPERRVTVAVCGMGFIAGGLALEEFLLHLLAGE